MSEVSVDNATFLAVVGLLLVALSMVWSELWPNLKRLYLFLLLFPKAIGIERCYLYLAYCTGKLTRRRLRLQTQAANVRLPKPRNPSPTTSMASYYGSPL